MAVFHYKAVNAQGKSLEGSLDAPDSRSAASRLQNMGLIPVSLDTGAARASWPGFQLSGISRRDVLFFTEEFATLIRAGLPVDRSLSIAAELASNKTFRAVVEDVLKEVKGGSSLADALGKHPRQFTRLYVSMIQAGEAGGVLDVVLDRLADFERTADELRSYLIASLIYPGLLTAVGMASIGILMYFVMPRFKSIFDDIGAPLPAMTQGLLWFSDVTTQYWWAFLLAIAAVVIAVRTWLHTREGSRIWDSTKLRLPLLGDVLLKLEVARFARTLGTLISSSVPLIAAMRIVQNIARNQVISGAIARLADGAKRGEGVARPMRESGVFPPLAVHLVQVGEETGRLDSMLIQAADAFDRDVKTSIKALTSVFEPAIILVMGVVVGAVVLSMLMAIFSINEINF